MSLLTSKLKSFFALLCCVCLRERERKRERERESAQPNAGRNQATKGWSEYTTTHLARAGQNIQPKTQSRKFNYVILNQKDSCNCVF